MIPRLTHGAATRTRGSSWPSVDERQATPLFLGRQPFRKLVVLLDSVVLDRLDESAGARSGCWPVS